MQENTLKAAGGKRHYVMRRNVIIDDFLLETWRPEENGMTFFKMLKEKELTQNSIIQGNILKINQFQINKSWGSLLPADFPHFKKC